MSPQALTSESARLILTAEVERTKAEHGGFARPIKLDSALFISILKANPALISWKCDLRSLGYFPAFNGTRIELSRAADDMGVAA